MAFKVPDSSLAEASQKNRWFCWDIQTKSRNLHVPNGNILAVNGVKFLLFPAGDTGAAFFVRETVGVMAAGSEGGTSAAAVNVLNPTGASIGFISPPGE